MCGIAGFSLTQRDAKDAAVVANLARELLLNIEPRGRDATGIAFRDGTGQVWHAKADKPASQIARGLTSQIEAGTRSLLAHTRYATQGCPTNNANNHPIDHDGIVLVHNGVLHNDDDLFDATDAPRYGEVDSEAIAALLSHGPDTLGVAEPWRLLELVEGRAAIAWYNVNDTTDTMRLARVAGSPLVIAQTRSGSFLFASTRPALYAAARFVGWTLPWVQDVPEGTYLRVRDGRLIDNIKFTPARTVTSAASHNGRAWEDYRVSQFATRSRDT